jgi:hypothetical protein
MLVGQVQEEAWTKGCPVLAIQIMQLKTNRVKVLLD